MSRYLLDTNAAADMMVRRRGVPERVKAALAAGHDIGIGVPVLGELYAGIKFSASRDYNFTILRRSLKLFRLWPFTPEAAAAYGRLYAALRRKGRIHPASRPCRLRPLQFLWGSARSLRRTVT